MENCPEIEEAFVIGGSVFCREFVDNPVCPALLLVTEVDGEFQCGTFFPAIPPRFECNLPGEIRNTIEDMRLSFDTHSYVNKEEEQYLDLVSKILNVPSERKDRTGTGTLSTFGECMRFDLSGGKIPLLTPNACTGKKGVREELLWMISGSTSSKDLEAKGINMWTANSPREFLDGRGLDYNVRSLGPVYGFQWRHFGSEYSSSGANYAGIGTDQLQNCIDHIRTDLTSRRIVMSAWNPLDLDNMALPPCHCFVEFYVDGDGRVPCSMTQRSGDISLGTPFKFASYSFTCAYDCSHSWTGARRVCILFRR